MADYRHLQVSNNLDVVVVRFVDSKLNDFISNELGQELRRHRSACCRKLLLNFSGVTHVSSSVLSKLLLLNRKMNHKGGKLRACEIAPDVRSMFVWTKLEAKDTEANVLKNFAEPVAKKCSRP